MPEADALLVRSATTVDAEVLAAGTKLKIVARAGVGLDNVDVDAATARGVLVVNAPTSNIHSAAEHAVALLLSAARQIPAADATLRERTWKRSSFSGTEIFGKTVGVVGLGRIGQLVAQRLAAFGTHVVAYDPYVSRGPRRPARHRTADPRRSVGRADFISVHLPKTKETAGLIGKEALAKTKPGVIIVNAARGGLIDEAALADAIASGHVRGAGLDVFATEPCTDSPLFELPQVVVTPHLGASTAEAQDRAGTDVAAEREAGAGRRVRARRGERRRRRRRRGGRAVAGPGAQARAAGRRAVAPELPTTLSVQVCGELASEDVGVLRLSALRGLFSAVIEDQVTFVNAPALAAERGVEAEHQHRVGEPESPQRRRRAGGRRRRLGDQRRRARCPGPQLVEKIVQINGRNFDLRAEGVNLIINYVDQPGALGKIGTLLGAADINIHAAQLSEDAEGPSATILLRLDQDVPAECGRRSPSRRRQLCWKSWTCREAGGHRRRRHRPRGHRRGRQGARRGAARRREDRLRPGRAPLPRHRRGAAGLGARRAARRTTRSCWARSAIRRCPAACWSAVCCCALRFELDHHVNLRPARLYPGVASPLAGDPGDRLRRRPRGHRGPVHRHRRRDPGRHAARDRHRGQRQHRLRGASGWCATRSPGRAASRSI